MTMEEPAAAGPPPDAYIWANAAKLPDPELFNAVDFYYRYGVNNGVIDPPCNPRAIGRINDK